MPFRHPGERRAASDYSAFYWDSIALTGRLSVFDPE
jgi:hypothetical protein